MASHNPLPAFQALNTTNQHSVPESVLRKIITNECCIMGLMENCHFLPLLSCFPEQYCPVLYFSL